jgi:hypothetical protein
MVIIREELLISLMEKFDDNVLRVASELSESHQTIMASLKKHDISFEKPKHVYARLKEVDFSDFQKSVILGSVLGDGHIEKLGRLQNARFVEEHSVNQTDWLRWKHKALKPFTTSNFWNKSTRGGKKFLSDGKGGKKLYNTSPVVSMSTMTHPYLTYMHTLFYKNRKKGVDEKYMVENFDLTAFSVLNGDDGSFNGELVICTDNFSFQEVEIISYCISRLFKGRISIREVSGRKNSYRIYMSSFSQDRQFLLDLLDITPVCMHYKVPQFSTNTKRLLFTNNPRNKGIVGK